MFKRTKAASLKVVAVLILALVAGASFSYAQDRFTTAAPSELPNSPMDTEATGMTAKIIEEFDSSDGFTSTDPDVYIQDGKVYWHVYRDGGEQYVYRSIPSFSGDVRLTVSGQVDSAINNCQVKAGIGDGLGTGASVNFGFTGGGCPTNGYVIKASGASLDYSESNCTFTGNWLWINSGTQYAATLTLANDTAELSVPGVGSSFGTPTYNGLYNTLYVGLTGGGDWPSCSGTIERMVIEPLNGPTPVPTPTPTPGPTEPPPTPKPGEPLVEEVNACFDGPFYPKGLDVTNRFKSHVVGKAPPHPM